MSLSLPHIHPNEIVRKHAFFVFLVKQKCQTTKISKHACYIVSMRYFLVLVKSLCRNITSSSIIYNFSLIKNDYIKIIKMIYF